MGTLKSTRTRTRLPCGSKSRMVSLSMVWSRSPPGGWCVGRASGRGGRRKSLCDERGDVSDAAAVAPLVVVPRDDLHEVAAQGHRGGRVDDRRAAVAAEVRGDEGLVRDAQDALERT